MATGIEEQKPKSRLRVRIEDPDKIDLVELRRRLKKATDTVPPVEPEPPPIVPEPPEPVVSVEPVVTEPKAPFPWRWVAVGTGILVLLVGFVWVLMSTISSWQSKDPVTKVEPKEPLKETEPPKPEPKESVPVPVVPKQPKVYEPIPSLHGMASTSGTALPRHGTFAGILHSGDWAEVSRLPPATRQHGPD